MPQTMTPRCEECHFWQHEPDPVDGHELGICRRFPPSYDGWAMTGPTDWCGEFRPAREASATSKVTSR